ncbi:hypothetical protein E4U17_005069 [Claviceps sp. LM77 group G4]|nr:hypothetical protein E4U17_005069 [Claviceps sp. LM77 group G4]
MVTPVSQSSITGNHFISSPPYLAKSVFQLQALVMAAIYLYRRVQEDEKLVMVTRDVGREVIRANQHTATSTSKRGTFNWRYSFDTISATVAVSLEANRLRYWPEPPVTLSSNDFRRLCLTMQVQSRRSVGTSADFL